MKPGKSAGDRCSTSAPWCRRAEGRVILSGDTRQHGPVEASDALRAIERYSGLRAAELNEIRRQDPTRPRPTLQRKRMWPNTGGRGSCRQR